MPLTPQRITRYALERTAETTFDYGGETCHLTYYTGRVTAVSRADLEAWQADVSASESEDAARVKVAEKLCEWLAGWDVLASDEPCAPMYPLEPAAVALLDLDFLGEIVLALFRAAYQGNANGMTTPARSVATSRQTADGTSSPAASSQNATKRSTSHAGSAA